MFRLISIFVLLFGLTVSSPNIEAKSVCDQPLELALEEDGNSTLSQQELDRVFYLSAIHWGTSEGALRDEYKIGMLTVEKEKDTNGDDTYKVTRTIGGGNNSVLIIGQL